MPELGFVFGRESDKRVCSGAIVAPAETRGKELGLSKKRFALLLAFPAVIALAVMLVAATGAGAASTRVSPARPRGAKSSASSVSARGVSGAERDLHRQRGVRRHHECCRDWAMINHSEPLGIDRLVPGQRRGVPVALRRPGRRTSAAELRQHVGDVGTISNWLLTPVVTIAEREPRSRSGRAPRRPEQPSSPTGSRSAQARPAASIDVGTSVDAMSVISRHLLLDINPTYSRAAIPTVLDVRSRRRSPTFRPR